MEQQEKQTIRSQRLRRAVTCLKRKEREEGDEEEEDSEEEMCPPSKSNRGTASSKSPKKGEEEKKSVAGGGFLGLEVVVDSPFKSLKDVSNTNRESLSVKAAPQSAKIVRQSVGSSSSSGEDSDGGGEIAMVTARSVFESSRRGRGAKTTRGRKKGGQRGRGKKL